jgi:hypothetical protein
MLYYPDRSLNATSTVPTSEVRAAGMLVLWKGRWAPVAGL